MPANDLSLSIRNPILIYSFLALYGLLMVLIITYVHTRFRLAARTLELLQSEWQNAESKHSTFVGLAQEQLSKLKVQATVATAPSGRPVGFDLRNQVVAMAKRGIAVNDIARACGLQEAEVDVILGMARLQR